MKHLTSLLQKLWPRTAKSKDRVALVPLDLAEGPVYAIGDPHGCLDLLRKIEAVIAEDAAAFSGRPRVVILGDVIDRGPESSALLDYLLRPLPWGERLVLRGNHEEMMLGFATAPHANAEWLDFGGFETLLSYGLSLQPRELAAMSPRRATQTLAAYLPEEHLHFLQKMPYGFYLTDSLREMAPIVLAHAGYNPSHGPRSQDPLALTWGNAAPKAQDGIRLVHGHVITDQVDTDANCIGIDTGAYKTGNLTALRLASGQSPRHFTLSSRD